MTRKTILLKNKFEILIEDNKEGIFNNSLDSSSRGSFDNNIYKELSNDDKIENYSNKLNNKENNEEDKFLLKNSIDDTVEKRIMSRDRNKKYKIQSLYR